MLALNNKKIDLLNNIGIDCWQHKFAKHMWYDDEISNDIKIEIYPLTIYIKCLVLLPVYKPKPTVLKSAVQQILTGMLKVLKLQDEEISIAKIYAKNICLSADDWQRIYNKALLLHPKFILQLEKNSFKNTKMVSTFNPIYLLENPQDKKLAYKDLLDLGN